MSTDRKLSGVRLTGFAAASLWHRRMVRSRAFAAASVHPRLSAELVLQSLRHPEVKSSSAPRKPVEARHAA